MYLLSASYCNYDQLGDYYVAVFLEYPTKEELVTILTPANGNDSNYGTGASDISEDLLNKGKWSPPYYTGGEIHYELSKIESGVLLQEI